MITKIFIIFVLLTNFMFISASTIGEDILRLQSAPKEDRYKIMNMIKLKLSKMNAEQRSQSIQKLFQAVKHQKSINTHENSNNKFMHNRLGKDRDLKIDKDKNFQNHFMKKGDKHFPKDHKKSGSMGHRKGHE